MSDYSQLNNEDQELLDTFAQRNGDEQEPVVVEQQEQPEPEHKYAWKQYSDEELEAAERVYNWAQSLTADQVQLIDDVMRGKYTQPQVLDTPPSEPELDDDSDSEINELRNRLAALERADAEQKTVTQVARTKDLIENTSLQWAADNGLSEDELEVIQTQLVQSGMFQPLASTYGVQDGLTQGLNFFFHQSELYQQKEQQRIADEALARNARTQERARNASAFAGGTGSVNVPDSTPVVQGRKKRANLADVARFIGEHNN